MEEENEIQGRVFFKNPDCRIPWEKARKFRGGWGSHLTLPLPSQETPPTTGLLRPSVSAFQTLSQARATPSLLIPAKTDVSFQITFIIIKVKKKKEYYYEIINYSFSRTDFDILSLEKWRRPRDICPSFFLRTPGLSLEFILDHRGVCVWKFFFFF